MQQSWGTEQQPGKAHFVFSLVFGMVMGPLLWQEWKYTHAPQSVKVFHFDPQEFPTACEAEINKWQKVNEAEIITASQSFSEDGTMLTLVYKSRK